MSSVSVPATRLRSSTRSAPSGKPSLRIERSLLREDRQLVAGMDEVGRGALAGPVTVGVVVVDAATRTAPLGLRDSKLIPPATRTALVPKIRRWAVHAAVGEASPVEIDEIGIIAALRLAGRRALAQLPVAPHIVILDGNHDWLTGKGDAAGGTAPLFGPDAEWADGELADAFGSPVVTPPPVVTMIKADMRCSSVAAASVLAKTTRDAQMVRFSQDHPRYGWDVNKGYAAPTHLDAIRRHGPCVLHRTSWSLPELTFDEDPIPGTEPADETHPGSTGHDGEDPMPVPCPAGEGIEES